MAQQLSRQGQQVAILIMLDTKAPTPARNPHPQSSLKGRLTQITSWAEEFPNRLRGVGSAIKPIVSYVRSGLFLLATSDKQISGPASEKPTIIELLGWAGLDTWRTRLLKQAEVASAVSQETSILLVEMPAVRRILELVGEHRRLVHRYAVEMYRGRITLFRAIHSERYERLAGDHTMGWGRLARDGVEVHTLPANHVSLLVKPCVEILAKELKTCIDGSRRSSSEGL